MSTELQEADRRTASRPHIHTKSYRPASTHTSSHRRSTLQTGSTLQDTRRMPSEFAHHEDAPRRESGRGGGNAQEAQLLRSPLFGASTTHTSVAGENAQLGGLGTSGEGPESTSVRPDYCGPCPLSPPHPNPGRLGGRTAPPGFYRGPIACACMHPPRMHPPTPARTALLRGSAIQPFHLSTAPNGLLPISLNVRNSLLN